MGTRLRIMDVRRLLRYTLRAARTAMVTSRVSMTLLLAAPTVAIIILLCLLERKGLWDTIWSNAVALLVPLFHSLRPLVHRSGISTQLSNNSSRFSTLVAERTLTLCLRSVIQPLRLRMPAYVVSLRPATLQPVVLWSMTLLQPSSLYLLAVRAVTP